MSKESEYMSQYYSNRLHQIRSPLRHCAPMTPNKLITLGHDVSWGNIRVGRRKKSLPDCLAAAWAPVIYLLTDKKPFIGILPRIYCPEVGWHGWLASATQVPRNVSGKDKGCRLSSLFFSHTFR
jgi:hypothetical protein